MAEKLNAEKEGSFKSVPSESAPSGVPSEVADVIVAVPENNVVSDNKAVPTAEFVEDVGAQVEIVEHDSEGKEVRKRLPGILHKDGKRELQERECYDKLGFSFPKWKKIWIITVIFWVQMSMNFNTSVYPNGINMISEAKDISLQKVRVSQLLFLCLYGFACELWAPWSEEFGRWPIMQLSLFLVNVWQILGALAPNFGAICVARAFGGMSSAGGSVTLGMVADLWEANDQGYAVAYVVLSSVGGTVIGPIFGGLIENGTNWHWVFWIQLIFGGVVQFVHFFFVPETRATILVDREAKRRRKSGEDEGIYGPNEVKAKRIDLREFMTLWARPFVFFIREPIVTLLSLLSGFSDCLIFIFTFAVGDIYSDGWGFSTISCGLVFIAVLVGYLIAYALHMIDTKRQMHVLKKEGDAARFAERRLLLLLFLGPLEPMGLFIFAWTSGGSAKGIPWIAPTIALAMVGIANYSIYMATIDYMIMSYGPYSASACGGNGWARDFLSGISAMYAGPMYAGPYVGSSLHYQWASTILGILGILVVIPIYIFYWKGPLIRRKSKFAQTLAADRQLAGMLQRESLDESSENENEKEFY